MILSRLAALVSAASLFTVSFAMIDRTIPGTEANQDYFATTQALFALGEKRQSSCGADRQQIEDCILNCNSPGLLERSGCCCIALPSREFFIGIRGGCRYRQQLLNFTSSLVYSSRPAIGGRPYFNARTCAPTNSGEGECECSLSWELSTSDLEMASPLPSPSSSTTPGLTPSASPSAVTPEPSEPPLFSESPTPEEIPTSTPLVPPSIIPAPQPSEAPMTPEPSPVVLPGPPTVTETPDDVEPSATDEIPLGPEGPGSGIDVSPTADVSPDVEGSEGTTPTPTPTTAAGDDDDDDDGTVCVEESHLIEMGVPRDHMVHAVGKKQTVLCPPGSLPCGTVRHKIRRQGVSMSYGELCEQFVQCEQRKAVVNSVYTHLWEETEHDDGVTLTMYDTAYPESAQVALHSVMSAGRRAVRRLTRSSA